MWERKQRSIPACPLSYGARDCGAVCADELNCNSSTGAEIATGGGGGGKGYPEHWAEPTIHVRIHEMVVSTLHDADISTCTLDFTSYRSSKSYHIALT